MIKFIDMNVDSIIDYAVKGVEEKTGEKLHLGDEKRLFINGLMPLFIMIFSKCNYLKNQNYLEFAEGEFLDFLGKNFYMTERLKATKSYSKGKIVLSEVRQEETFIESGRRISAGEIEGEEKIFILKNDVIVPPGVSEYIDESIVLESEEAGSSYNNIDPGKINYIMRPIPYVDSITNIETTSEGSDKESDSKYKSRCDLALTSLSVAGPYSAYKYLALSAHNSISSVEGDSKEPGTVQIYALINDGAIATEEIKNLILESLNDIYRRPLTDFVTVEDPEIINYSIDLDYYISSDFQDEAAAWRKAIEGPNYLEEDNTFTEGSIREFVNYQKETLGRSISIDEIKNKIENSGLYEVKSSTGIKTLTGIRNIVIRSPSNLKLNKNQVAYCTSINVNFKGFC